MMGPFDKVSEGRRVVVFSEGMAPLARRAAAQAGGTERLGTAF